jgi:alanine racemase
MSRPALAHIRLDAFRHNYRVAKRLSGSKALAVVKANAYGHGAVRCAQAIANEADGFAVACIEEALTLRNAGISNPILLLEGFFSADELPEIVAHDLWIVVHHEWQVEVLKQSELANPVQVWLKMDTGMHRVGLSPKEYRLAWQSLENHPNVASMVAMTHFANADNLDKPHTTEQINLFKQTLNPNNDQLGLDYSLANAGAFNLSGISVANSGAIMAWPQSHGLHPLHWARPGIMLYGADPLFESVFPSEDPALRLQAVMQLRSKIIATRFVKQGTAIGYGSLFTTKRDTLVGVVACGYADGYPRAASSDGEMPQTPVAVDGKMTRLIGRVSMDMLFVDITDIPNANIGSDVELWGDQISANLVARAANTIAYELFCNVKRVAFEYCDHEVY